MSEPAEREPPPHEVTDAELDALTQRIRSLRRRQRNAKLAGVGVAFLGLVAAGGVMFLLMRTSFEDLAGRIAWAIAGVGALLGALLYRWLDPNEHVDDLE